MAFTAKDVQALRERTGCGMMDCKKALTASDGDMDKAVEFLREKGLAAAEKKAGRIAAEGVVYAAVEGKTGVVIEVNSETDFVGKNEDFQSFVKGVASVVLNSNPADVDALVQMKFDDKNTVGEALREKIAIIGENLQIRRFVRYEGYCVPYIHSGGRIGVLVQFESNKDISSNAAFEEMGKDVAMQIAALSPQFLDKDAVPAETLQKEKEILMAQIKNDPKMSGKPENIIEKMVEGRVGKFYDTFCLTEQEYVKDSSMKVKDYVQSKAKELGAELSIKAFTRFERGEGIEKKEDDFAAEVAKLVK